jgi:hypothetical protein
MAQVPLEKFPSVDRADEEAGLFQIGVRDDATLVPAGMDCHNSATNRSDLRIWPSGRRVQQRCLHSLIGECAACQGVRAVSDQKPATSMPTIALAAHSTSACRSAEDRTRKDSIWHQFSVE